MWIGGEVGWRGYLPFSADWPTQSPVGGCLPIHPPLIAQYTSWEIQCSLFIVNNSVNNTHTFSTD